MCPFLPSGNRQGRHPRDAPRPVCPRPSGAECLRKETTAPSLLNRNGPLVEMRRLLRTFLHHAHSAHCAACSTWQGPAAKDVLQGLTDVDLNQLYFSMFDYIDVAGVPIWITRTGYAASAKPVLYSSPFRIPVANAATAIRTQHWAAVVESADHAVEEQPLRGLLCRSWVPSTVCFLVMAMSLLRFSSGLSR